jgi:DNA-binding NarL/FixJ family response regulator
LIFKNKKYYFSSNYQTSYAHNAISTRELDVLLLLAQGLTSKQIGNQLFISPNTVDNHRRNMIARTGARDTTALVQLCRMVGLI